MNLKRRLEKIENHVKAWCGAADPPDVGPEPTSWFVARQEKEAARARVMERAGLTRKERLAWLCYYNRAAQLISVGEIEAQQKLLRAADLSREEFRLIVTPSEERPLDTQDLAAQAAGKMDAAWTGLDDETRALLEKKWKKENGFVAEIGKWTTDIDASDGPAAFSAAVSKVAAVLETLDDEEKRRLHLHDLWDLWSLGRA